MRSRSSSASSSSSIASPAQLRKLASEGRARNTMPRRSPSAKTQGSLMKLVQLAAFGLLLALVVPFVRSQLFGPVADKNAHQASQSLTVKQPESQPDVFDFKHEDYLARPVHKATPEDEAVVPIGTVRDLPATRKLTTTSTAKPSVQQQTKSKQKQQQRLQQQARKAREDEDDDGWSFGWLVHVLRAALHLLTFLSIPFRYVYRGVAWAALKAYFSFRWGLSHTLRPVAFGLAPLVYLFNGMVYIFVQVPTRLLTAAVTEFYPLYLFLGAASVIGITMGLGAAAVLYITSFIFVDRSKPLKTEPIDRAGKGMRRASHRRKESAGKRRERVKHEDDEQDFESSFNRAWVMGGPSNEPTPPSDHDARSPYEDAISPSATMHSAGNYFAYPGATRHGSTPSDSPLASPAAYRSSSASKLSYPIGATARHGWGPAAPVTSPSATKTPIALDYGRTTPSTASSSASSSSISTAHRFPEDTTHSPVTRKRRS